MDKKLTVTNTQNKNQGGFMSLKLSEMKIPVYKELWNPTYNYFSVGEDNKFFLHLIEMYQKSAIHSNIINNLHFQICKDQMDNEFYKELVLDWLIFGGMAVEVIWNVTHTQIVKMNHLDFSNIRMGKPDDSNNQLFYYYSQDWFKYSNRKVDMLQAYNPNPEFENHQIFVAQRYFPGENVYPLPYYWSGAKWIITDIELENYFANLVQNSFMPNTLINIPVYFDQEKQKDFEKDLKDSFTGSENAGRIFVTYSEDKDHAPTIENMNNEENDTKYQFISEQIPVNVSIAHNYPAPLLGLLIPGKLGSSQDLPVYQALYKENMVDPTKSDIDRKLAPLLAKKISII